MSFIEGANNYFDTVTRNQSTGHQFIQIIRPDQYQEIEYNRQLFYSRLQEQGILLDEIIPILEQRGNMTVVACAGAGKTTVIILKRLFDYVTGADLKPIQYTHTDGNVYLNYVHKKVLVSTFLSSGAEDIRQTYTDWSTKLGISLDSMANTKFATIHAEVMSVLRDFNMKPDIIKQEDVNHMISGLMLQHGVRNVSSYSPKPTMDEIRDVASIIGYARNVLDGRKYMHQLMVEYNLDSLVLDNMIASFKTMKQALGKMDFEDLQEVLYEGLTLNQAVANVIAQRYDVVIVDEFQDTSQLQYGILLYYFAGVKEVITIGDDDQTIYSWRGSDINIILERFPNDMQPAIHMITRNFRCRENILNAVIPSITKNQKRFNKQLRAFKQGGQLRLLYTKDAEEVMKHIKDDIVQGRSVGVIARVNMDLLIPAILLELDGQIDYNVSKGINMRSGVAKQVLGLMDLILKRYTPDFAQYFKTLLPRNIWHEANMLVRILDTNTTKSIYNIPEADMVNAIPTLYNDVIKRLRLLVSANEEVAAYLFLLNYLRTQVFTRDNRYHVSARDFIDFMENVIMNHSAVSSLSLEAIDRLFNMTIPTKLDQRMSYSADTNVKLTTAHEAKGKEWDSVYIWNDVEGTFPTNMNRELTPAEVEEERRVHYIAWTRAKDILTVITQKGRESMFLKECDLSQVGVTFQENPENKHLMYSKPSPNSIVSKPIEQVMMEYKEHINCLELDTEEFVNFNVALTNFGYEGLTDLINRDYGVELLVNDDVQLQKTMQTILARIVDNIYNGHYSDRDE